MKTRLNILILCILSTCISCSDKLRSDNDSEAGHIITFSPAIPEINIESKADLYDSNNLISNNSGNFSVIAYKAGLNGADNLHFKDFNRVFYFKDDMSWQFYNADSDSFYQRYWPEYALDFLAFMPYDLANTGVTVTKETQSIECTLPTSSSDQQNAKEFVYAFTAEQSYSDQTGGVVALNFIHPFAALNLKLGKAHGNTYVDRVEIRNIAYKGSLTISTANNSQDELSYEDWTLKPSASDPDTEDLIVSVRKTVGISGSNGIQTNSPIGGPYILLPQETAAIRLYVNFVWNSTPHEAEVELTNSSWTPGKIYTYTLDLGDDKEDVKANVTITDWTKIEYKNEVDVE